MWHDLPDSAVLGFLGQIGPLELTALAIVGLLIFGKRLPEVGRSIGRGIVEFKRGLSGIEDDLDQAAKQSPRIEQQGTEQTEASATNTAEPAQQSAGRTGDGNQARSSA